MAQEAPSSSIRIGQKILGRLKHDLSNKDTKKCVAIKTQHATALGPLPLDIRCNEPINTNRSKPNWT